MILLRPFVIVALVMLTTCEADRLRKLEVQMKGMKAFQSYVMTRLDTIEGDFGTLTDRVSMLESLVNTSYSDTRETDSVESKTGHTVGKTYSKSEISDITKTLTMYKHSFKKHKKELTNVNSVFKDTLSTFVSNASSTVSSLVSMVNAHVLQSAENISATLQKVNNTVAKNGRKLRSDSFIYLSKLSSDVRTDMTIQFENEKQENNKTLLAINSQVGKHVANETDTLERFKTNILQDLYAAQANVQNETIEMEKKVEELIGRANEVVGIIEEQRSTIEDRIMVTIKALHISWTDWSAWSDCSRSCDKGSRSRHRSCDVTPPFTDGICIGSDTDTEECVIHEICPFHISWTDWSAWSDCSRSCDKGSRSRHRSCDVSPPFTDGICIGSDTDTEECVIHEICPYDCSDVLKLGMSRGSGVYRITPWNTHKEVEVNCDMDTEGGGWTVFQRRYDGSVAFNRSFADYERGFGSLDGEFWTGLDVLHSMTSRGNMTLRVDMSLPDGTTGFDEYAGFYISPPDQYNFNVDRRINSRGMSDSFLLSNTGGRYDINHQPFSTYDRDADNWPDNCAQNFGGGWWYNGCMGNNLNGPYTSKHFYYHSFKDRGSERLKTSTMMFR